MSLQQNSVHTDSHSSCPEGVEVMLEVMLEVMICAPGFKLQGTLTRGHRQAWLPRAGVPAPGVSTWWLFSETNQCVRGSTMSPSEKSYPQCLRLGPLMETQLLQMKVVKMRSYWSEVGPLPKDRCSYKKTVLQRQKHRGEPWEEEGREGAMCYKPGEATDCRQRPKAG